MNIIYIISTADLGDWTAGGEAFNPSECGVEGVEDQRRVRELHRLHRGQSRAAADLHYLEHARRLDGYGIDAHPAKVRHIRDYQDCRKIGEVKLIQ